MRTIIDIPQERLQQLDALGQREELSRAELIRRAIAQYLEQQIVPGADAFGLWKGRHDDGVSYQQSLRAEWEPKPL